MFSQGKSAPSDLEIALNLADIADEISEKVNHFVNHDITNSIDNYKFSI